MDLGFRSSLKIAEKVLRKSLYQEIWGKRLGAILAMAGNPASVSCDFLLSSRDSQLAQNISNQKQTGALPGKDHCLRRHYALNYFMNSICSPSIAQRPLRFQQVLFFSAHFHGRCFARPS